MSDAREDDEKKILIRAQVGTGLTAQVRYAAPVPGDGDDIEVPDVIVEGDDRALTIRLSGPRFEGGRLPLSALSTLTKTDAMVKAIARDLEMASREDAGRASRYAKVELVLVGEIGDGSALVRALIVPIFFAASLTAQTAQATLLDSLPEAVPSVVQAVHEGTELEYPVSLETVRLVAAVGQNLGAGEQLVLRPADIVIAGEDFDDGKTATVTLASTNEARQAQQVSDERSFFVTGQIRRVENHGDEPGKLTLATKAGLYPVPSVGFAQVERAAGWLSQDRNVLLAISGRGEFDGKGRLKKLTHLTDMRPIDNHFNPDRRLAELAEQPGSPLIPARIVRARPVIERAVLATGRAPGLFLDEDDRPEARWLIHQTDDDPGHVVSVSFGEEVEVYVFDRAGGDVVQEASYGAEVIAVGDLIADIIDAITDDAGA